MKKDAPDKISTNRKNFWELNVHILFVILSAAAAIVSDIVSAAVTSPESGSSNFVKWLITSLLILTALFLLLNLLVSLLTDKSKRVKYLKNNLTDSFIDAIERSSFNPKLKGKV